MNKYIYVLILSLDLFICLLLNNSEYILYDVTLGIIFLLVIYKQYNILKIRNMTLLYVLISYGILVGYYLSFIFTEMTPLYILRHDSSFGNNIYWLSIGILSLCIGSIFALKKKNFLILQKEVFIYRFKFTIDKYLLFTIYFILFISYSGYFLYMKNLSYAELHLSDNINIVSKMIFGLNYFLIVCFMILSAKFKYFPTSKKKIFLLSLAIYIIFYAFLLHIRSPILSIVLLFGYFNFKKDILSIEAIMLLIIFVSFLLIISFLRDANLSYHSVPNILLSIILGLGQFADTISYAIGYLEKHGISPGISLLNIFSHFKFANDYANTISPEYFDEGGGFGFFYFSEILINFGKYGGVIFMAILGYTFTSLLYVRNIYLIVLNLLFFINTFGFIRNDFSSTIKGLIYTYILFLIILYLIDKLPHKNKGIVNDCI